MALISGELAKATATVTNRRWGCSRRIWLYKIHNEEAGFRTVKYFFLVQQDSPKIFLTNDLYNALYLCISKKSIYRSFSRASLLVHSAHLSGKVTIIHLSLALCRPLPPWPSALQCDTFLIVFASLVHNVLNLLFGNFVIAFHTLTWWQLGTLGFKFRT